MNVPGEKPNIVSWFEDWSWRSVFVGLLNGLVLRIEKLCFEKILKVFESGNIERKFLRGRLLVLGWLNKVPGVVSIVGKEGSDLGG